MVEKPEVSPEDQAKAKELRDQAWKIGDTLKADAINRIKHKTPDPADHDDREREYWSCILEADKLDNPSHFRLNAWGMSACSDAMQELGMEHWPSVSGDEVMKWPAWDDSLPDDEADEKYERESAPIRTYHSPDEPPTIPGHKLGSNDGWHVTPDEIRAALAAWDARPAEISKETREITETQWWANWIDYLRRSLDQGGFYVH
ncbi:hypothetical protein [Sinomonas sp.]|uniref:hypothetical protein n=1 Tax=Sinomonas sp. TaxID=1914986 RepID=UPI003F7E1FA4